MADNINYNKESGEHAFVSRREKAWHGLGTVVEGDLNTADAIKKSHLNYIVNSGKAYCKYEEPLILDDREVKGTLVKNTRFTYRTDNGIILMDSGKCVTDAYTIVQNVDAFDFFDQMLGSGQACLETAGALGKGETIFITAKLPEKLVINKDEIEEYLLLTNTHDGSGSIKVLFTNIRVVCNNTLNMALQGAKNKYAIKHTKNVNIKLNDLAIMLREHHLYNDKLQTILHKLAMTQIGSNELKTFTHNLIFTPTELALIASNNGSTRGIKEISTKKKNMIDTLQNAILTAPGQDVQYGSYYWLYNGVTSYQNNIKKYDSDEARFNSVVLGINNNMAQKAFEYAVAQVI